MMRAELPAAALAGIIDLDPARGLDALAAAEEVDADTAHPRILIALSGVLETRLLAFRGQIRAADARGRAVPEELAAHPPAVVAEATLCLVLGNAGEKAQARERAARVEAAIGTPRDYLTRGCLLLAVFGLIAIGEVDRSRRLIGRAGGDDARSALVTVDRAIGLETLAAQAAARGDRAGLERPRAMLLASARLARRRTGSP